MRILYAGAAGLPSTPMSSGRLLAALSLRHASSSDSLLDRSSNSTAGLLPEGSGR